MTTLQELIPTYFDNCEWQKRLDTKTLKAYKIDLRVATTIELLFATGIRRVMLFNNNGRRFTRSLYPDTWQRSQRKKSAYRQ